MKIAIIGTGSVGSALGGGFAREGHEVTFGVRDTGKPKVLSLVEETGARAGSVADAAAAAEVVVLAMPWTSAQEVIQAAGGLDGKIVLDCINPLKPDLSGLDVGGEGAPRSAAEQVAAWAPGARVVKIFNTTGAGNMVNPRYGGDRATMLYCGDDTEAKKVAARLAEDLGFETVDAGPLPTAYLLEHHAMLWIHLAYAAGLGRDFAFRLVRRPA
ncbi:MAG TPA: NADPH-dependent F420 reductase, partial [Thermoanaerobaculia bacterium]|nr:NADPH-dependent F420 reductase [Thermoanaerobaculia bacterium]